MFADRCRTYLKGVVWSKKASLRKEVGRKDNVVAIADELIVDLDMMEVKRHA